jgi:hypothetical protein
MHWQAIPLTVVTVCALFAFTKHEVRRDEKTHRVDTTTLPGTPHTVLTRPSRATGSGERVRVESGPRDTLHQVQHELRELVGRHHPLRDPFGAQQAHVVHSV